MPETMSPREKMENALYSMEDWRHASPEYLIENILAALASSGDHAELARDIRKLCVGHPHAKIAWPHYELHALADRAEALIAEVAALRGERDRNWEEYLAERQSRMEHGSREAGYLDQIERLNFRATEAERKLAEAVGIASKLSAAISWLDYPFIDNNTSEDELRSRVGFMMKDAEQPRAMLSKEAEPAYP